MTLENMTQNAPDTEMNLLAVVSRLRSVIEQETHLIATDSNFDFKESSERKSRLLFELNKMTRTSDLSQLDGNALSELAELKLALGENAKCIEAHLIAVNEVSDLMVGILKNEDADGTYSELM